MKSFTAEVVLLPCPFCGGLKVGPAAPSNLNRYVVQCFECGATSGDVAKKADAAAQWNKRRDSLAGTPGPKVESHTPSAVVVALRDTAACDRCQREAAGPLRAMWSAARCAECDGILNAAIRKTYAGREAIGWDPAKVGGEVTVTEIEEVAGDDVLDCPFCGKRPSVWRRETRAVDPNRAADYDDVRWLVCCVGCLDDGTVETSWCGLPDEAVTRWNTRATPTAPAPARALGAERVVDGEFTVTEIEEAAGDDILDCNCCHCNEKSSAKPSEDFVSHAFANTNGPDGSDVAAHSPTTPARPPSEGTPQPCPFCGATPIVFPPNNAGVEYIACVTEGCVTYSGSGIYIRREVWDRRAARSVPPSEAMERTDAEVVRLNFEANEDGSFTGGAGFKGGAVELFAAEVGTWFREAGGVNFVESKIFDPTNGQVLVMTIQRAGGKTPNDLREEAEAKLTDALDAGRKDRERLDWLDAGTDRTMAIIRRWHGMKEQWVIRETDMTRGKRAPNGELYEHKELAAGEGSTIREALDAARAETGEVT